MLMRLLPQWETLKAGDIVRELEQLSLKSPLSSPF